MKLKETDFSEILKNKFAGVPAVLIYGPDNGKIDDCVAKIAADLAVPPDNLISAAGSAFRDKFDAIYADACSMSMFGGNKLVVISDMDGRDLALLKSIVESGSLVSPVVVKAGELESKNTLRLYFEGSEKCAALPLYADDERALGALIRKTLGDNGVKQIDADALGYMYQHLGRDRAVARGFLQKIALYVCASDRANVTLEDAEECLPDAGAANMDEYKYNLTAGNITQTLRALDRLLAEQIPAAQLVRVLGNHFKDLLNCVAGGQMPRVFWKYAALFDTARKLWTEKDLSAVLVKINRLESDTRSGQDSELIFRDFSLKLATKAYKIASERKKNRP